VLRYICIVLVTVFISLSISSNLFSADLVANWTFDQNAGEEVKDVIGGHNGKIVGKTKWVAGKFKNGLQITGPSSYVEVKKSDKLELKSLTLIVWVNLDGVSGRQEIASYADSYGIFADNAIFKALLFNGGNWNVANGVTQIVTGEWYQVAQTVSKDGINLYVNGKLDAKLATPAIAFQDFPMWFGGGPADNQFWMTGIIDEIEIWNDALSEAEIEKLVKTPPALGAVSLNNKLSITWANIKK